MVTVWPHDGIVPLELWDVVVGGRSLFARRDEPTFYASLASAILALRRGEAVRESGARVPVAAWSSVAVVGGAVDHAGAGRAFADAGITLEQVAADPWFAVVAAERALRSSGDAAAERAVVVDVGQTRIKAVGNAGKSQRPRRDTHVTRAELVRDVGAVLAEASGNVAPSFALVALPCEVEARDDEIRLGPSTYPTAGDGVPLVREILEHAGCAAVAAAVVNDAVLAAWALAKAAPSASRSRLVLTLGFGVGAALDRSQG